MGIRKLFAAKDMTQGAPWQRILEFSIPMLLGNIAQQLYNTADSVIVGIFVGDNALAAVGSAMPILNLLLALFVGIATGAGIVISQAYGARDREGLSKSIGNCITLAFIATLVIMALGPLLTSPMLKLLGTPDSILGWCSSYLIIQFLGIAGFFFYNMLSGVLRGLGDSVSALGFLLLAAGLNVVLDLVFVAGFGLGVAGVSLATVIAQGISAYFCFRKLMKMGSIFDLNKSTVKLDQAVAMRIIRLGVPSGITQAIFSMASMVTQSLTNSMGEMVIAANVIIMRVDGFAMMPNMTFGQAMSVYTGQNVGAGKLDRVHQGTKQGLIMNVAISAAITVIILIFGPFLFDLFTDTPETIAIGARYLWCIMPFYPFLASMFCINNSMRGAGDSMFPMICILLSQIFVRVPVFYYFADTFGPYNMYYTYGVTWAFGAALAVCYFLTGRWKRFSLTKKEE